MNDKQNKGGNAVPPARPPHSIAKWVAAVSLVASAGATIYGLYAKDPRVAFFAFIGILFGIVLLAMVARATQEIGKAKAHYYEWLVRILVTFMVGFFMLLTAALFPAVRAWLAEAFGVKATTQDAVRPQTSPPSGDLNRLSEDEAAMALNDGNRLRDQAKTANGQEAIGLLTEAVNVYHKAATLYPSNSTGWAAVHYNLSATLRDQAKLSPESIRSRLLTEATAADTVILEFRPPENPESPKQPTGTETNSTANGNPAKKVTKSGVNKAFQAAGLPSPFGSHPNVPPIKISGKNVYVLHILDVDTSRCTNNYDVDGQRSFRLYICNVDPGDRLTMRFQRKGDKRFEDSDRGPVLNHSKETLWTMEGGKNYLAARGFTPKKIIAKHDDAVVLLIEDGLNVDDVLSYFKD